MTYFVTVELALGAWVASADPFDHRARFAIFIMNLVFGAFVAVLIALNYRRRLEVVMPMRRALRALQLEERGAYVRDESIHAWEVKASWRNWYIGLVVLFCAAQALPLFFL